MKRYLLFGGGYYYPMGGWLDFEDSYDTIDEAKENLFGDWCHLIDSQTGDLVEGVGY